MAAPRSSLLAVGAAVLLGAGIVTTHEIWFGAMGRYLVQAESPVKADIAVVLAGDGFGRRIVKAAELVKKGFVPKVLVSGPPGIYGLNECDLAIPYAVKRGYPEKWFIHFPVEVYSTRDEARAVLAELRKRNVKSFLVVTSDYHTRRAGGVFHEYARDLEFHVVAAEDEFFRPGAWWGTRQGQKVFAQEWTKTLADWLGI